MSTPETPASPAAPTAPAQTEAQRGSDMARGARKVSVLTMLSRVLGLVREQIFAVTLGAGGTTDAFLAAFRIPNLLRDLFAEGALSTAFVPTYVKTLRQEGRAPAFALANRVMSTLFIYLGSLAALAMLFPEPVVRFVATGFGGEKAELTARLMRIMMPFLPIISLAVVAMGALNAEKRYTAPALASSSFNVVAILGGAVVWALGLSPRAAVTAWAVFTLGGGLAQLAIQVPGLWRLGYRPRFLPDVRLRDGGTRRIALLMAPAALGVAAVQINVVVSTIFASMGREGSISWLGYAFRLMQLPIGVFGVAIATTTLTHLSHDAAAEDHEALRGTLRRGLGMVLFLTVPSTVGLWLLAEPIIRLIFQHGRFSAVATIETARALGAYSVGLAAYSAIKVMAPAFYALGRTRVPLLASVSAVAANIVWNVLTFRQMGHVGLALGTSLAAVANLVVLVTAFQLQYRGLLTRKLAATVARIVVASLVMGGVVWLAARGVRVVVHGGALGRVADVVVPIAAGAAAYFGAARVFGIGEARTLLRRRG